MSVHDYRRVPRPWLTKNRTRRYDRLYDALERTAVDGDAVEIPVNGAAVKTLRDALRRHLAKRGLHLRAPRFGNVLRVWAEEHRLVGPAKGQEAKMRLKNVKMFLLVVASLLLLASPAFAWTINLSWSADAAATSYKVEKTADSGTTWVVAGSPTTNSFTHTGTEGGLVLFRVSACNTNGCALRGGDGLWHNEGWVAPLAPILLQVK